MLIASIIVLIYLTCTESSKILIIVPYAGKSHNLFIRAIAEEVALQGHDVTYYTVSPSEEKVKNITEIQLKNKIGEYMGRFNFKLMRWIGGTPIFGIPGYFIMGLQIAEKSLNDPVLAELINSDETFDLVMLETHFGQEALIAFGHKFQAPVISLHPFSTFFCIDEYIGNPFGAAYVPSFELPYTDKMTFIQRVHNTLRLSIFFMINYLFYMPRQDSIMRKYFNYTGSESIPSINEMLQNISLIITNTHVSIDYQRPLVPNVIATGGLHISPHRKPLPQDLKEFMDNSKNGVIYVSFGAIVPVEQIPNDMKEAFIKAFGKLKQNVLWKFPLDKFPGQPKNVKISKWLPQQDILAHPNCLAFITHGGILSQEEAVYFGVPLIGIPFFGDQSFNIMRAVDRGFAVHLNQYNITEESVFWAINEILSEPKYRENAKKYSNIFQDNPLPPKENVVYWIEYILRHKGAPHLRSEGRKLPYYKYLLLDVIAFMTLTTSLIIYVIYKVIKICFKPRTKDCKLNRSNLLKKKIKKS